MKILFTICCCFFLLPGFTQNLAEVKFHEGSNLFINGNPQGALASVNEGLKNEPSNEKLKALKKLLEDQKKKQDQQKKEEEKKKQQQQQKDQQNKDQDKKQKDQQKQEEKDKEKKEQEEKKDQEQKDKEDKEKKDQEQKDKKQDIPDDVKKKLEEMKIDPEKAKMILDAMRNQEVQYLQQRQREGTKPRQRNKPDW